MATPIPSNRSIWSLEDVVAATGGHVARRGSRPIATGAFTDSRAVMPEALFLALRGETMDGHSFLADAIAKGAVLLVVERGTVTPPGPVCVVEVDDTLVAWGALAAFHVRRWRASGHRRVAAITGTAGKTTTKELTAALLRAVGSCHATIGNLNNRIGVPSVALGLDDGVRFAVFELGMSVPGEIAKLTQMVVPDVALITNVGLAHSFGVGGRDGVAREKGAIFSSLPEASVAVVNLDDDAIVEQTSRLRGQRRISFGAGESADYRVVSAVSTARGAGLHVDLHRKIHRDGAPAAEPLSILLPMSGRVNAVNFAGALAVADAVHGHPLSPDEIASGLRGLSLPPGRAALHRLSSNIDVIDDSYNSNPTSMRAALDLLGDLCRADGSPRRSVVVFGEMRELGADAEVEHRRIGSLLGELCVAVVIGCGGMAELVLETAREAGVRAFSASSAPEAALRLLEVVAPGDVVLVKGSRGVRTEAVVAELQRAYGISAPTDRNEAAN